LLPGRQTRKRIFTIFISAVATRRFAIPKQKVDAPSPFKTHPLVGARRPTGSYRMRAQKPAGNCGIEWHLLPKRLQIRVSNNILSTASKSQRSSPKKLLSAKNRIASPRISRSHPDPVVLTCRVGDDSFTKQHARWLHSSRGSLAANGETQPRSLLLCYKITPIANFVKTRIPQQLKILCPPKRGDIGWRAQRWQR
jgi:hypothetical protein